MQSGLPGSGRPRKIATREDSYVGIFDGSIDDDLALTVVKIDRLGEWGGICPFCAYAELWKDVVWLSHSVQFNPIRMHGDKAILGWMQHQYRHVDKG